MKKIIFVCMLIFVMSTTVFAADVNVQINGENVNFTDSNGQTVNAQVINSRTMVPMRKIFEVLGAEVEWDGETRTVTGSKENIEVKLQIDNNIATKTINGVSEDIILDTPPMLVDSRTMVPLRFIAESLDKQVGWDSENRTAIIIDYGYFSDRLKNKLNNLYAFLESDKAEILYHETEYYEVNYKHKYYDLVTPTNDTEFNINSKISVKDNVQKVTLNIFGTSELSNEIVQEGWNSILFDLIYSGDQISLETENFKLKEMFAIKKAGFHRTYDELELAGSSTASLDNMFRLWAGIKDDELNVNTFTELKKDFDSLCNMFLNSSSVTAETATYNTSIRYSNYNLNYFDLTKFDNFIFDSEYMKAYNVVNKLFFKEDLLKDEMLYDNSNIKLKVEVRNFGSELNIFAEATNDYNEKNEYTLNLKRLHLN